MTKEENGAFILWVVLIIVVAVVLDGGWVVGAVMALAGVAMALVAVRRRRANRPT